MPTRHAASCAPLQQLPLSQEYTHCRRMQTVPDLAKRPGGRAEHGLLSTLCLPQCVTNWLGLSWHSAPGYEGTRKCAHLPVVPRPCRRGRRRENAPVQYVTLRGYKARWCWPRASR